MHRIPYPDLDVLRTVFEPGRRVRFVEFGEADPTELVAGSEGAVAFVDSIGTVHVDWDNGARLGIVVCPLGGQRPDRIAPIRASKRWSRHQQGP